LEQLTNTQLNEALLGFNGEVSLYCKGISDSVAQDYAVEYARMLGNRVKGMESELPRVPHGLFEPNRKLIRLTLDRMCEKYFPRR
jgi:hypothetical protein